MVEVTPLKMSNFSRTVLDRVCHPMTGALLSNLVPEGTSGSGGFDVIRRWMFVSCALVALSGCAVESVSSTNEAVAQAAYRHNGPAKLTLFTMISNSNNSGAHSSLMINGSQRVIFDPAGTFRHEAVAEQGDVIFGATPKVVDVYTRYHARETYHVLIQELNVSPAVAERAIQAVRAHGSVPGGKCAQSTSTILASLPGFEHIQTGWFPKNLSNQMAAIPGVKARKLHEYDSDDNSKVLKEWNPDA